MSFMLYWNRVLLVICCWTLVGMWTEESRIITVASLESTVAATPQSEEMLIQNLAEKVMSEYLTTVNKRPDWLHVLLTNVKHEWQMRTAKLGCNTTNDFCLYRLDYLAQPSKLSSNVGAEALAAKRDRRAVEGDGPTKEVTEEAPKETNAEPLVTTPDTTTTKVEVSSESISEPTLQQEATAPPAAPSMSSSFLESSTSTIADPVSSTITEMPMTTMSTTTEATTTGTLAPETTPENTPPATTESQVEANKVSIMRSCNEAERKECKHAKSCDYVYLVKRVICKCKAGFMGTRCDMFDLGMTVEKLTPYQQNPINIATMRYEAKQDFLSVIEASSRYTLNVYVDTLPD